MSPYLPTTSPASLRVGSLLVLASALFAVTGVAGVVFAVVVAVVWVVVRTPYAVAVGQLLYALTVADGGSTGAFGVGSFVILFVPDLIHQWQPKTAAIAIIVLLSTTTVLATTLFVESALYAASLLCFGFGVVAYAVYRYELVQLGLVDEHA